MLSHYRFAILEIYPSFFNVDYEMAVIKVLNETFPDSRVQSCILYFKRVLRRKLVDLKLIESVNKNILVQNWFRKIWALQLVPPFHAHAIWVWKNHIKTSVPYEDVEQTIQDDPEKVDDFNEALVNKVTYFELT